MTTTGIESYRALYERALAAAPTNPDGSSPEAEVLLQLKLIVPIDVDAERERKAKHIIDWVCKSGLNEGTGQLCFPDFGSRDWEPLRVIRSDDGNLIENGKAILRFKVADTQRSAKHAEEAEASRRWKQREVDIFTTWTFDRMQAGEKASDLTWGRCVEELGLLDSLAQN